ncbi:MmpS family transport accessory protein [Microbacterium sp. KSW2-29]|uniref:MmpS family transport accessory protein n=1 Tax=Microbacterium phycohabitans TaxID=3075993 RepID=A0ABU3SPA2_9MICO|nr:MmpS family transport accessory protein [Microbacterium sp. KSW2-29]MDU0346628.1 MmpS family transport accessory protein [Microbacterium sp. KSW2-29]
MSTSVPASAPAPAAPSPKQKNGVGLASLIVGAVAVVFAIIPIISFIAWLPALAAIVLGIVGLVLKNRVRGFAWAGLALGVVAWIIAIVVSAVSLFGVAGAVSESIENATVAPITPVEESSGDGAAAEAAPVAGGNLVYEVTSDAATVSNVTYLTADSTGSSTKQDVDVAAPWKTEFAVDDAGMFDFSVFSLVAQADETATSVSCKITFNGEVISEQTSTGQFAVVTCSGSTQ